jgi:hypothetical protein
MVTIMALWYPEWHSALSDRIQEAWPAILRTERFDQVLEVGMPSAEDVEAVLPAACGQSRAAFSGRCIPPEPGRSAALIVAFRSEYTRYSSLTRLVRRAHRPLRRSRHFIHRLLEALRDVELAPSVTLAPAIEALIGRPLSDVALLAKWLKRGMAKANEKEKEWILDVSLLNKGIERLPKPPQKRKRSGIGFRPSAP